MDINKFKFGSSRRNLISFEYFLNNTPREYIFRNIFNVVSDMVKEYVGDGVQEYPNDPDSIGYVDYNMKKIFEENQADPFYTDRLFANRFVKKFKYLDRGSNQNKIYVFRGAPGSGKSTFLNCLVSKIEEYVNNGNGELYEVIWKLNNDLVIPCPSHDNPILLIPKSQRKDVFREMLYDYDDFFEKIYKNKSYEWVWNSEPCTFCSSMVNAIVDRGENVLDYLYVRKYRLNKSTSEGINVFNANDELPKFKKQLSNKIQDDLDEFFKHQGSVVKYDHSIYAKSNNGIYVLMDLNENNKKRFVDLRGIVSEGKHKVDTIEERVNSIFLVVTNPSDESEASDEALDDRKDITKMNYVLVPNTQNKIFKKIYGDINNRFHPNVIDCFSRIIISSRMDCENNPIVNNWIKSPAKYIDMCDSTLLILKMEIYSGDIPEWLEEEDVQNFSYNIRKKIIESAEEEGTYGISDRKAIEIFGNLMQYYNKDKSYISFEKMKDYIYYNLSEEIFNKIPELFIESVERFYIYTVVEQIKESIFRKNKEKIKNDIKNYLFSLYYNENDEVYIKETGDTIKINNSFYKGIEEVIWGKSSKTLRENIFKKFVSELINNEDIEKTQQFKKLYDSYTKGLKDKTISSFLTNKAFRSAIMDYNTDAFNSYDKKIKIDVDNLIQNMIKNYNYTIDSAKEVCMYIFDNI